jgi:RNA polymerase sigma factor (sigma-70 family)
MSEDERQELIRRARRLAMHGACQTEIARRLARKLDRSPETIRYTLKKFDRDYPEVAVFPNATTPLTEEHKRQLFRAFQRGVPVDVLARDWQRTRTSIYRIVAEVRARDILSRPLDYMPSDMFNDPAAEAEILGPAPERQGRASVTKAPPGLPPYLASLYAIPLLTREEEVYYFRKMNYLKSRAAELRQTLDPAKPSAKVMDQIERWLDEANEVKNFLIRSNLRLVVSIAKKHLKPNVSFFEMVSDGNMSLIRAIEKFDFTRGFKFSTYASWAIMKNYARSIPAEHQLLERFRTGHEEVFQSSSDSRSSLWNDELVNSRQREAIMSILGELEDREREILVHRYGLNDGTQPQTLEQVGQRFGVTKERIRQLEARALRKLRKIASESHLEIPGI